MSDRRTFLGNAAAAAVMTKISSLTSFGFATDGPETIGATMSDREKAGLRGSVKTCLEEHSYDTGQYSTATEYSTDGRVLIIRTIQAHGSEWVSENIYDSNGHLVKTVSGKLGELGTEIRYEYDDKGRPLTTTNSPEKGCRIDFHYNELGRKTSIQRFSPEVFKRYQQGVIAESLWTAAQAGIGIPLGGSATTIYNDRDQQTELQIRDAEDRLVSRTVRTYDANGRLVEEERIQENPALFFADKFSAEGQPQLTAAQLEAMNTAMKSLLRGRSGTGTSHIYDEQGRISKIHDRNFVFDKITIIIYNDQGDKAEERTASTENGVIPTGVPHSIDKHGALVPSQPAVEPQASPVPEQSEVHYEYQYDSRGNWTQQTANHLSGHVASSIVRNRKLTYY